MNLKKQPSKKALLGRILKEGKTLHTPHFSARFMGFAGQTRPLFSFVVSRKVSKSAVERNTLKRRGRHIVRTTLRKIPPSVAGMFFFKKGAQKLSFQDLKKEIEVLLDKMSR